MEKNKNLCAMISESLHAKVRAAQEQSGKNLSEYMTILITEYYDRKESKPMDGNRTIAFQIPEELFQQLKQYLENESVRTGRKISQKEFILGLIQQALPDAAE